MDFSAGGGRISGKHDRFVYGPVPSRRLGRSLGVDIVEPGTCSFSCVYCQLGRTERLTPERQRCFPVDEIIEELRQKVKDVGIENIDYITLVGDGEPLLDSGIGELVEAIKSDLPGKFDKPGKSDKPGFPLPVALITNGALLASARVREEMEKVDVVLPSLDAGTPETFRRINRPHPSIDFREMVDGMKEFRRMFQGKIWMEFMAVKGLNDTREELEHIRDILADIRPDRLYVNFPIRPPAEAWVEAPDAEGLGRIHEILGETFDIVMPETGEFHLSAHDVDGLKEELVGIIGRHPMRKEQVVAALTSAMRSSGCKTSGLTALLRMGWERPEAVVEELAGSGKVKLVKYGEVEFVCKVR